MSEAIEFLEVASSCSVKILGYLPHSCRAFDTILSRMHCLTPLGVFGSLKRDQHSSLIFCLTELGIARELSTSRTNGSSFSFSSPFTLSRGFLTDEHFSWLVIGSGVAIIVAGTGA